MKTAEEIAKKYADLNGVNQMDLELDILRYLEHHYKSWIEHIKPYCVHDFTNYGSERLKCRKCNKIITLK